MEGERSGVLELRWAEPVTFEVVHLREAIAEGQHISNYRIDVWRERLGGEGNWTPLVWGTTIGCCKLDRVPLTRTGRLRLVIEHAYDTPRVARIGLHRYAT